MDEILEKIQIINRYFRKTKLPEEVRLLQRLVKLQEEVGELSEAALVEIDKDQRKKDKETDFDSELADVIICALMLSIDREKDIMDEINKTLDKNLKRHNLNI